MHSKMYVMSWAGGAQSAPASGPRGRGERDFYDRTEDYISPFAIMMNVT